MRENYPEIHKVNEVQTKHIQGFLNSKTESCSQSTLNQYSAQFWKLEKCVNAKYHCDVKYGCAVVPASCKNGSGKIRKVIILTSNNKFELQYVDEQAKR